MGLAASQARLLALTARKSDLELQLQLINQERTRLAFRVMFFTNQQTTAMSQNNPALEQQATQQIMNAQQIDKILEIQANNINTQHEAVQTEIGAVQKVIQKNIQMSFKLMG